MSRELEDTAELDQSFFEIVTYHQRDFQQYAIENLTYLAPIDEDEIERLQLQHAVLDSVFDGRLIFPPVSHVRRVLDCGYGTGSWALEVAEQHPRAEVVAVDISPHMRPEDGPENLFLQVDDLNSRFTFPANSFDLVHSQLMAGGIHTTRWSSYLRDIFRVTRPGGWCQMVEIYYQSQSDNGSLTDNHALRQWSNTLFESHNGLKDLRAPLRLQNLMRSAGFQQVEHRIIPLHTCAWSRDARENQIGQLNRANVQSFLASLAVYPFTERLGMSIQDVNMLVARAQQEADNPALRAYFPLYVCIGRKPRR